MFIVRTINTTSLLLVMVSLIIVVVLQITGRAKGFRRLKGQSWPCSPASHNQDQSFHPLNPALSPALIWRLHGRDRSKLAMLFKWLGSFSFKYAHFIFSQNLSKVSANHPFVCLEALPLIFEVLNSRCLWLVFQSAFCCVSACEMSLLFKLYTF